MVFEMKHKSSLLLNQKKYENIYLSSMFLLFYYFYIFLIF